MAAFVARRIAVALLLVWGVVTVTFLLIHAAPGDPAELSQTKDLPLPQQYGRYLYGLARGDLGWSSSYQRPVASVLVEHLPPTLELTALAFALQLVAGVWAGSIAAWRRGSWADAILSGGSLALRSMPLFVLGALLILVFSVNLRWLPSSEMRDLVAAPTSFWGGLFDRGRHLFLPVICLGLGSAGSTARSVRSSLVGYLSGGRGLAARARGAEEESVLVGHALLNMLPRLVARTGKTVPFLLGGALIVENVFSWPGIGHLAVEAVFARDIPVVLAAHLALAIGVISASLLSDVCRLFIDPRLRLGRRSR